MKHSAPKRRKPRQRRISGVRASESESALTLIKAPERPRVEVPTATASSGTLPAFEPVAREVLPFTAPAVPENEAPPVEQEEAEGRGSLWSSTPPPPPIWGTQDSSLGPDVLPSSLMPDALRSDPPPPLQELPKRSSPVLMTLALVFLTLIATAIAWFVWRT